MDDSQLSDKIVELREVIDSLPTTRERALALTKLEECEMWLERCPK